jgi:hypothetical protein
MSTTVSEGQEKYFWELSIIPVGYFTGAIKNHCRDFAWRKSGILEQQE